MNLYSQQNPASSPPQSKLTPSISFRSAYRRQQRSGSCNGPTCWYPDLGQNLKFLAVTFIIYLKPSLTTPMQETANS